MRSFNLVRGTLAAAILAASTLSVAAENPDAEWGWASLQSVAGARNLYIPVRGHDAQQLVYIDKNYDANKIERVVVTVHGHGRDVWNYYTHTKNALKAAQSQSGHNGTIDPSTVLTIAPQFFGIGDKNHGAIPTPDPHNTLCWLGDEWSGGEDNLCPSNVEGVSTFESMDGIVKWLGDGKLPKLQVVVLNGHSLGGQYMHRYASVAQTPEIGNVEFHYWIANPASWLYLEPERPASLESLNNCPGYNDWKYGLDNYTYSYVDGTLPSADNIWNTYSSRYVHSALGTADHGAGNLGCEATVQGKSHLSRGMNYFDHLQNTRGGLPAMHTIDYVQGIQHDAGAMMSSQMGVQRLFYENNAKGNTQPSDAPDGISNGHTAHFRTPQSEAASEKSTQAELGLSTPSSKMTPLTRTNNVGSKSTSTAEQQNSPTPSSGAVAAERSIPAPTALLAGLAALVLQL